MSTKILLNRYLTCVILLALIMLGACKNEPNSSNDPAKTTQIEPVKIPAFSGDSAYSFVEAQLAFGHRVPGMEGHKLCKEYLVDKFKSYSADVKVQDFKASFLGKSNQPSTNIIATFNHKKNSRILIAAHWDSRLIAEKDKDLSKQKDPIMGADDGASGVGLILELARIISENPIDLGVDFILFDAEDQGINGDNWCIGSQYWSRNLHKRGYKASHGILLDMVGADNARFGFERNSMKFDGDFMKKVWKLAKGMGSGAQFQPVLTGPIEDDHYYVNTIARIPMIDIINIPHDDGRFGDHHHTHKDDIGIISKSTLRKVGQVVTAVLYKTSEGSF